MSDGGTAANEARTVSVEQREHDVDHVLADVHVGDRLRHVLQRLLVDRGARQVVEGQCRVHVGDRAQQLRERKVLLEADPLNATAVSGATSHNGRERN